MEIDVLWANPNVHPISEPHLMAEGVGDLSTESFDNVVNIKLTRRERSDREWNEKYPKITVVFEDGTETSGYGRIIDAQGELGSVCAVDYSSRWNRLTTQIYDNVIGATWVERDVGLGTRKELDVLYWVEEKDTVGITSLWSDYLHVNMPNRNEVFGEHPFHTLETNTNPQPLSITGYDENGNLQEISNVTSVGVDNFKELNPNNNTFRVYDDSGLMTELEEIENITGNTGLFQEKIQQDTSHMEIRTRLGFIGGQMRENVLFKLLKSSKSHTKNKITINRKRFDSTHRNSHDCYSIQNGKQKKVS